jgi:hypothetical protein
MLKGLSERYFYPFLSRYFPKENINETCSLGMAGVTLMTPIMQEH